MRKTFCDRCGMQCTNLTTRVQVESAHHTQDGKFLAEDSYKPIELCYKCTNEFKELFPQAFELAYQKDVSNDQMSIRAESNERPVLRDE